MNFLFFFFIPSEYYLSLNGKDPLISAENVCENRATSNDVTLKDCNIVSGDLIHVVSLHPEESLPQQENIQSNFSKLSSDNRGQICCAKSDMPLTSTENNDRKTQGDETPSSSRNANEELKPMEYDPPIDHMVVRQCLSEPLLCRECSEGRVPPLLAKIYRDNSNEYEALIVALHVLMLESGYSPFQVSF